MKGKHLSTQILLMCQNQNHPLFFLFQYESKIVNRVVFVVVVNVILLIVV